MSQTSQRQPTLFLSHGGGPWPWIPEMRRIFARSEAAFKQIPSILPAVPDAVVVVSGHWEESAFTVSSAAKPPMVYDYYGFPEETYHIHYEAPGSQRVAHRVQELISKAGLPSGEDLERGFDHGTFVPLSLMYPNANIPVVSLSMQTGYDPAAHFALGEALKPLRDENVLVIGSGLSYHNMRGFRTAAAGPVSESFETWLNETISLSSKDERRKRLLAWEKAPAARLAHPQEDHLMPLLVVAGAAGDAPGERLFVDHAMGVVMASYRFAG